MGKNISFRNNIQIVGEGEETIVMAHGFGCDQKMWQYILPYFEKKYKIVLFDYVGSGGSDFAEYDEQKYSNLHGYKEDLIEVIQSLNTDKVLYFGHSVSSMIGLLAAIEQPQLFKQLIMIGPSPRYVNDETYIGGFELGEIEELLAMMEMNFYGWAEYMAPYAMGKEPDEAITKELHKTFRHNNQKIARQFAEATFYSDHRLDLGKCEVPTLILQCAQDSIVPIEVGEYMHMKLVNSTLQILQTKGHYPHISDPTITSAVIINYLKEA